MNMNKKAGWEHWLFMISALVGIIVIFNTLTGSSIPPIGSQTGVDLTAMVVLGA